MTPDRAPNELAVTTRRESAPRERPPGTRSDYADLEGDVKADVGRFVSELWNKHRPEACDECLAPEFVDHDPYPGQAPGREGFKAWAAGFLAAFPDVVVTIDDMLAEGSKCAMRMTWAATHQGEYLGIAPTGRLVEAGQMEFVRVLNGRILERWAMRNGPWLTEQIVDGHRPAEPGSDVPEISSTEDARSA